MKEYNLQEVIVNIEDGEEYKSDSPLWEIKSIKKVNGNINFIFNGTKNDSVGVNANQRFIKVETSVSFNDVIDSSRKCRVEHELITEALKSESETKYSCLRNNEYYCLTEIIYPLSYILCTLDFRKVITDGRWYLEE